MKDLVTFAGSLFSGSVPGDQESIQRSDEGVDGGGILRYSLVEGRLWYDAVVVQSLSWDGLCCCLHLYKMERRCRDKRLLMNDHQCHPKYSHLDWDIPHSVTSRVWYPRRS